jgi:hypothetical protein
MRERENGSEDMKRRELGVSRYREDEWGGITPSLYISASLCILKQRERERDGIRRKAFDL